MQFRALFMFLIPSLLFMISPKQGLAQQEARYPLVKGYGGIYPIPDAELPSQGEMYRVVIDLKAKQTDKTLINPGLNNVARMMNLHVLGGIAPMNLKIAVAVHGEATESILTHEGYRRKNGIDNPNIELIEALEEAGAEIYVCGQSLLSRGFAYEEVNPEVRIALSMLTTVTDHQNKGYHLLQFD